MLYRKEFANIARHYNTLVKMANQHRFVGIINEWFVDNYYLVLLQKDNIDNFILNSQGHKYLKPNSIIYQLMTDVLEKNNYKIDELVIIKAFEKYEKHNNYHFSYQEIQALPIIAAILLIKKISNIATKEALKLKAKKDVDNLINTLKINLLNHSKVSLSDHLNIKHIKVNDMIVYLNEQLKELGNSSNKIFKELVTLLDENNMSLRMIINETHLENANTNIVTANVFNSLNKIFDIQLENLYDRLSAVEKLLNNGQTFSKVTVETKILYRSQLIKLAKKKRQDPYDYLQDLIKKKVDIGEYLLKKEKIKGKTILYLSLVLIMTLLFSYGLAKLITPYFWVGFICLLIPVSEIVINILKKIFLRFHPSKPLPKLSFSKGIPSQYKTMVVIPTIVKDEKKVKMVFDRLESFYLSNKTENIYFTLLGDCSENSEEIHENDKQVIEAGFKITAELNKKYGKERFYFAYRRRKYNSSENTWLGYERKRGALLHFNDLLLGNLSKEKQAEYFQSHTFHNFKEKIKYVITLDVDTRLCLNTSLALVGTMAHPLNRPILNKKKNKVIKGYGILQPKISIDVDSTNKSLFSQIYAGIGGFDPYSSIFPDFYQDVFDEGCFVGKGIYDLAVFQQVLKGRFPNNLILSHDLLEGSYLRCANVLDIELIDDFPSKFLVDATRRSRWARGDFQIINWITNRVHNEKGNSVKNPLPLLAKWKIFDNIRRGMLDFTLLLLILLSFTLGTYHPLWWLSLVILVIIFPVLSYIREQFILKKFNLMTLKYYNVLTFGMKAIILRSLSVFSSIPFNAYLYLNSFAKSWYRMHISKEKLLNWMTAEEAEKVVKTNLSNHVKRFSGNYIVSLILVITIIIRNDYFITGITMTLIFSLAPLIAYYISKDLTSSKKKKQDIIIGKNNEELTNIQYLNTLAAKTWQFFADNLDKENNYLITDNYQLNRDVKRDIKTSPTNIGLSLISIISAYELELIPKETVIDLTTKIIDTIKKLPKWNGHLYNWYNIKTLEIMYPSFISLVDSANFVASLIVVKEALKKFDVKTLVQDIDDLIKKTEFKHLYTKKDLFSVGYNVDEGVLLSYSYNKFMSESRIASFIAIAKGDVPSKHWFALDKTLTSYKSKKGVASWSGTAFEYFMPLIFMKSYPNTLIDESYYFAYYVQKDFINEVNSNYPWGISESAYNELDDAQNYKYKAFGIPYLRFRNEPLSRIVLSPYSSILAITRFPEEVISNMKKYTNLHMEGDYGFYEAYDANDEVPVYSYYAHHQGMILSSLVNYLKNGIIQDYFGQDTKNNAFTVLIKERVQVKPYINFNIMKYQKYSYDKEPLVNDMRVFHHISTLPELSVLSNSKYSLFINDRGNSYSRYRGIQLNRYRKITEQDYGMFLYIKDLNTNKIWSNTYAPMNVKPTRYEIVFALDRIKFVRTDGDIITTTEIAVTKHYHAEIRKVTFKNTSNKTKYLELTTYTEPILCENITDISHPAFSNMFINSEYDNKTDSIIVYRKLKESNLYYYMINRLLIEEPEGEYEFETNRENFIGRNNNLTNPKALKQKLTNHVGTPLDPIISLRNRIKIPKNEEVTVYLICGFGKSKEQVLNIVGTFSNDDIIKEQGFDVATLMSNVTNKMVNITGNDMRLYNTMLNYLFQTTHFSISDKRNELLGKNTLNQTNLWRFGISGDHPIILLEVKDIDDLSLVKELLHAFEYYKSKSIFIDLVIINCENKEDAEIINKEIEDEKYHMYALNSFNKTPGNIRVLDYENVNEEETTLFRVTARMKIDTELYNSLQEHVNELQRLNTVSRKEKIINVPSLPIPYNSQDLKFFNDFGGFINNGKEYLIVNKDTPAAWSNILANRRFGTITTNNNCGFTYALNSREFKLTGWTNDTLLSDRSEGIKINDMNISFAITKFGFGYNEYLGRIKKLNISLTEFVALEDLCKFYRLKIENNAARKQKVVLKYWINPTLGVTEEKTSRHLLCNFDKENNAVTIRNAYIQHFNNQIIYMSSTEKLVDVNIKRILFKDVEIDFYLDPGEEKEVAFILGCTDRDNIQKDINKYNNITQITEELEKVKCSWNNQLQTIQVKTPEESFDYMVNGWLLYQTLSSRLYAKAGFYQVGGAYGFRDQLQDSMNICMVNPQIAREQIILNAKRQFSKGDVLHWWHEQSKIGLRSLYKDDYLWLIYATSEYLTITGDYLVLNEQIEFIVGPELESHEKEKGINFNISENKASLYVHCKLALEKAMNDLGENGLPLMGGGDWNDGMNKIGVNGKGTSVWLGFFLYLMVKKFIAITKKHNPEIDITLYHEFNDKLELSLKRVAWDGEYYLRAFFDNGNKLGSHENDECTIDLLSQSFAILTDIATKDQIKTIINSVEDKLVDQDLKIIKLLTPAFKDSKDDPGYIMNYPTGIRENGGQYTHSVAWYLMALIKIGKKDQAFDYYQMINPINRSLDKNSAIKYKVEPYVIAADIYSNDGFAGKGGWTWYTGSAAWFYRVAITDILGFNKVENKLYFKPNVPSSWTSYDLTYTYKTTIYEIHILLNQKNNEIELDGNKLKDDYIDLIDDGLKHTVVVKRKN